MESGDAENLGSFRRDFLEPEIKSVRLDCLGRIDAQVDKGGGDIGHGCHFKSNRPTVFGENLADLGADFSDTYRIHPALEEDPQGSVLQFMSKRGAGTTVHQVIHSRQSKNALDFGRAA